MSIKTTTGESAVYCTGHLIRYPHQVGKEGPESESRFGTIRCNAGIAEVSIEYCQTRDGLEQYLLASTVRNGRERRMHQVRTGRDMVTERGAKRVVLRWLRELEAVSATEAAR